MNIIAPLDPGGEDEYIRRATDLGKDVGKFIWSLQVKGLSVQTLRAYYFDLLFLHRWMGEHNLVLEVLKESDVLQYIDYQRKQNAHPASINRRITSLRQLYRFCLGRDLIRITYQRPYARFSQKDHSLGLFRIKRKPQIKLRVKEPQKLVDPLSVADVRKFIQGCKRYRDVAICLLMLLCGLRSMEVLNLKLTDIDLLNRVLRIKGKGNKERMLPLPEPIVRALEKYLKLERINGKSDFLFIVLQGRNLGDALQPISLYHLFRFKRLASGIKKANPHRFRHTFGAQMAKAGVKFPVLQKMMGHSNGKTTLQYINLAMTDVAEEFQQAMIKINERYEAFGRELT
ncbi:MAG: tyrosine-type recombinase/integrase [Deltaproteobacteria bacterium]|nr:tyrosine-type recombinase/integrase [Deltaproteobacteria bacterium]